MSLTRRQAIIGGAGVAVAACVPDVMSAMAAIPSTPQLTRVDSMTLVWAESREVLVDYLRAFERPAPPSPFHLHLPPQKVLVFVHLTSPCGAEVQYPNIEDLPHHDVPCSCGNPKHWFIRYGASA